MQVGLLGPLTVTADGGPIVIAAGRQRTLLATLALRPGRVVRADELTEMLWGDAPPATALKTLQTYVARLRRVLPQGWITSTAGGYALTLDPALIDAAAFEKAVAEGSVALRDFRHSAAIAALERGLALWRGEPTDLGDQPGGRAAATWLCELRLGAEDDLAEARLAIGGGAELVPDLEAAVHAQPLRERRWCQLMVALYRAGRQADALRAFQRARQALVEGLGIEPGPELRATERAVIDRSPTLLADGSRSDTQGTAALPPPLAALSASPIVGRAPELAELAECWREVARGRRRIVVIHGEAGIGKTRLVAEAAKLAHADGGLVLYGRCEREALTPYQAMVDALRPFLQALPVSELGSAPAWELVELARLVPELGDRLGHEPGTIVEEAGARHRLFEAVASFIGHQVGPHPVVLIIDDVHWIEGGDAAMVRHLLRAVPARILVLATHRSAPGTAEVHAGSLISDPLPGELRFVPIGGLDQMEVRRLAELAGATRRDASQIHVAAGGNPLLVTELMRFRVSAGRLPDPDEVPLGLRHVIARRLAGLSPSTRRLVEAAAVGGIRTTTHDLAGAADLSQGELVEAVEEAASADVLSVDPSSPGAVFFTHDLVRTAVLQELSALRSADLHRRLATAIAASMEGSDARAAEVAHHLASAAAGAIEPSVSGWVRRAAAHARAQLAWEQAVAHFEVALVHLPAEELDSRIDVLTEMARTLRAAGRETDAARRFSQAVALARSAGRSEDAARIALSWTEIPVDIRRDLDDAIRLLRQALDELPDSESPLRAQLMGRLAFSQAWARDPTARVTADAAVTMARATGDPISLARTLQYSTSSRDQFEAHDPAGCAGELHRLLPHLEDPVLKAQALNAWFVGSVQRGGREAADRTLHRLRAHADRHHLIEASFRAALADAHLALLDGHLHVADRAAAELLRQAERSELRNLFLFAGALLFDVRRAQGRLGELLEWFEPRRSTDVPRLAAMRARALSAAGRIDEAATVLTAMTRDTNRSITPAERPHSLVMLSEVAAEVGNGTAAGPLLEALRPWSGLIAYDGVNGPLEPIDSFISRLEAVQVQTAGG